ncbi:MAG: hypothetical protein SCG72_00755, partial [Nitrosarchaeum sp.]|nr:hypothetical protein [Nitrosarchaeum sp.]
MSNTVDFVPVSNKKTIIGITILSVLSILIWIIPEIIGFNASVSLRLLAIVLLAIYVVLAFEIIHRMV